MNQAARENPAKSIRPYAEKELGALPEPEFTHEFL
jgi:hypothetical protein